jgi:hypothetical protein
MSRQPRYRLRLSGDGTPTEVGGMGGSCWTDPYRLDRRREKRHEAEGLLRATYSNGVDRFGITNLDLVDRSARGLGVRTRVRLDPGETVKICPKGSTIPWVSARVVRCVERGGGYVVGMRYCGSATAA